MKRRLKSWARTMAKLALLLFGCVWATAAYKLVYAQTHDLSRFSMRLPISYYQQTFFIDSLLKQTWMFGPDFREYIGDLPDLSELFGSNPQSRLAGYARRREEQLAALPVHYPHSLFREEALDDAWGYSRLASVLSIIGSREQPALAFASVTGQGRWNSVGIANFQRAARVSRALADRYPGSSVAPGALLRVAQAEEQESDTAAGRASLERLLREYPVTRQAEEAAESLYRAAVVEGKPDLAREYKRAALLSAERRAREHYSGAALPAPTAVTVLGFRVDLSGLELRLRRIEPARTLIEIAAAEAERLKALPALDEGLKGDLRDRRRRLDRARSELWVADLYKSLKVGVPGPPPRPDERAVRGKVLLEGRPLSGVTVGLTPDYGRRFRGMGLALLGMGPEYRFRAVSDHAGEYRIEAVPAGRYRIAVVYPTRPGGTAVVPSDEGGDLAFPSALTVNRSDVTAPILRLRRAVDTLTFGEVGATGKAVRLAWKPWPGAAAYGVELRPAPGPVFSQFYRSRAPRNRRQGLFTPIVIWSKPRVTGTSVDCPLLDLAPDVPAVAGAMELVYTVKALDASGRVIGESSPPLSRFHLSQQGRDELLKLNPPIRTPRGPGPGEPAPRRPARSGGSQ